VSSTTEAWDWNSLTVVSRACGFLPGEVAWRAMEQKASRGGQSRCMAAAAACDTFLASYMRGLASFHASKVTIGAKFVSPWALSHAGQKEHAC